MTIDGAEVFEVEGWEYKVQVWDEYAIPPNWINTRTNQFERDEWYPDKKGAKNAMAQLRATRYGRPNTQRYRLTRRPYGAAEVVED